jgi:hypothetical protein
MVSVVLDLVLRVGEMMIGGGIATIIGEMSAVELIGKTGTEIGIEEGGGILTAKSADAMTLLTLSRPMLLLTFLHGLTSTAVLGMRTRWRRNWRACLIGCLLRLQAS